MNQELILDYCFYLKKRLFISDGSFIMPAPTEILHLKCCICKTRIFLSDRRRNVCINYFIPPPQRTFLGISGNHNVDPSFRSSVLLSMEIRERSIYFMQEHWKFLLHKNNVMIWGSRVSWSWQKSAICHIFKNLLGFWTDNW